MKEHPIVNTLRMLLIDLKHCTDIREHDQFIEAWNNGLNWYINLPGGEKLQRQYDEYRNWLAENGFKNMPDEDLVLMP